VKVDALIYFHNAIVDAAFESLKIYVDVQSFTLLKILVLFETKHVWTKTGHMQKFSSQGD
jgi:hypothetical protein